MTKPTELNRTKQSNMVLKSLTHSSSQRKKHRAQTQIGRQGTLTLTATPRQSTRHKSTNSTRSKSTSSNTKAWEHKHRSEDMEH